MTALNQALSGVILRPADIEAMSYVDFIALLQETNRCPGGKQTIRKIIQNAFINPNSYVLEIGSNTGFTSLELARTIGCRVVGLEPVPTAVAAARAVLATDITDVQRRVTFVEGSAYDIPFPADTFDVLVAGGATSFMADKDTALAEYHRVLKPWGFLSITNLCYHTPPPQHVLQQVGAILGVAIPPWTAEHWLTLFADNAKFECYFHERHELSARSAADVDDYVTSFLTKPHLAVLPEATRHAIYKRWHHIISVFNENHRYLGFILSVFRKRHLPEEQEFFYTKRS